MSSLASYIHSFTSFVYKMLQNLNEVKFTYPFLLQAVLPFLIGILCFVYNFYSKNKDKNSDDVFKPAANNDDIFKPAAISDEKVMNDYDEFNPVPIQEQFKEDRTKGVTNKYKWTQNDTELEMFIFVCNTIKPKDILLDILSTGIVLTVLGKVILDGDFVEEVVTSECNWQLDEDEGKRVIWITLHKKIPTPPQQYWISVLENEYEHENEDETRNTTVASHEDTDTEEFHRALNQIKKKSN